ncbi:hypothetical protein BJF93_00840 [Xaviernesmea oryzae]|uniref:Uncharacterized protein n=1 Tax=Xaviernesmea oryzae TaxID=464029 RepID=A0A1Q9B0M2_9HYPH|nr:hypothetical protein [Xaviernesmea oryzae]OLP61510.1 hypothetical protein BJF93_00840 [Xaviernesmea oryzae]
MQRRLIKAKLSAGFYGMMGTGRNAASISSPFIVFALKQAEDLVLIRPISARFMHAKEIRHYEKG